MKIRKFVIMLIISTLLIPAVFAGDPIPEWYTVDFSQYTWFANNQTDIQWNYIDRIIGQVEVRSANNWWEYKNAGEVWNGNFTLVISSPINDFHLTNVDDNTKIFPAFITAEMDKKTEVIANTSPTIIPFTLPRDKDSIIPKFYITISPNFDNPLEYQGTYISVIHMEVYVDYGLPTQVLIDDSYFNVLVYFITQSAGSGGGGDVFTNLMISRYPGADGVDIPTLQNSQGSLTVAGITFSSNDNNDANSYEILISPGEDPIAGEFAFFKDTNPAVYIPYKVHVPTRTVSYTGPFSVAPPDKGPADFWTDFFELAITEMNYPNPPKSYTAGDYTSLIQIQLIKN